MDSKVEKRHLARILGDILSCPDLSEEMLAHYAELEMDGRRPDEEMPEVGAHLEQCPDCAERYATFLALLQAEAKGEVPVVRSSRPLDLSFLPTSQPRLWTRVQEGIRRLTADVPILRQRPMPVFGPLPTALVPCRVTLAPRALRGPVGMTSEAEGLEIPDQAENLLFTLLLAPSDDQASGLTLIVRVQSLEARHPLAQVRVNLYDAQARLLRSQTTKADGQVTFGSIAGSCVIQCKHAGKTWEFPLTLR